VDDKSWAIHELVIETGHGYWGKQILIPTGKVNRISYEEVKVFVSLSRYSANCGKRNLSTYKNLAIIWYNNVSDSTA
jgi:hypothetical protein